MLNELDVQQVKGRRLTEEVVNQLVSLIAGGKLKRGDKLPPERVLTKQLGVGRCSFREAIGSLSLTGVLSVRPGSGTYVTISGEEFLAKPLRWGIPMGRGRVQELVEARNFVEQATVALAAERASEAEIAEIRHHLSVMEKNRGNLRKVSRADVSFHVAIAQASHNAILESFIQQIRNLLQSWVDKAFLVPGIYDSAIKQHAQILSEIEARNTDGARAALCKHLDLVGDTLASVAFDEDALLHGGESG